MTANSTPPIDHEAFDAAWSAFEQLVAGLDEQQILEELNPRMERYRAGLFRLVVLGEEKRGKSSFVNALLGAARLLPVGDVPMTSVPCQVVYGESLRYRVYLDDAGVGAPARELEVDSAGLAQYCTEAGNPHNGRRVSLIRVEMPHPLLATGLVIVDLPGLGGLRLEHSEIAEAYLPKADAAFFVVDSQTSGITRHEADTLEKLLAQVGCVIVVQTKKDAVARAQWEAWRDSNLAFLNTARQGNRAPVPYFVVSSTNKLEADALRDADLLDDSGFGPLLTLLHEELLPAKLDLLAAAVAVPVQLMVPELQRLIDNRIAVISAESKEAQGRIAARLDEVKAECKAWQEGAGPELERRFGRAFEDATAQANAAMRRSLNPAPHGPIVTAIIEPMEHDRKLDADAVIDGVTQHLDRALDMARRQHDEIVGRFLLDTDRAYDATAAGIVEQAGPLELGESARRSTAMTYEPGAIRLQRNGSTIDHITQGRMRFLTTTAMGGVAYAAATVLFPPIALGVGIASLLASLAAGASGFRVARVREKTMAVEQLRLHLAAQLALYVERVTTDFSSLVIARRRDMDDSLRMLSQRRSQEEQDLRRQLEEASGRERSERKEQLRTLREQAAVAARVLQLLHAAGFAAR